MKNILLITFFIIISTSGFSQISGDQKYSIESTSSGRFLNGKNSSEIIFDQSKNNDLLNVWKIIKQDDGSYKIKDFGNNKFLAIKDTSQEEGTKLILQSNSNFDDQKWIFTEKNGFYIIKNKLSGLVITVDSDYPSETDPNPDLNYALRFKHIGKGVQRSYSNKMNQEFKIEPVIYNPEKTISVPELGWKPDDKKLIMLTSPTSVNNLSYTIKDENNATVISGNFTLFTNDIADTWNLYYYTADISQLSTPRNYTVEADNLSAEFKIADDIYLNIPYTKGGIIKFKKMFNGFWKYNKYYPQTAELLVATLYKENNIEYFTFNGETYDLPPYGWFDAHSRDSKIARTAKVLSEFSLAYFNTNDADNKYELYENLKYGIYNLLLNQNEDGSWPAGKIRDNNSNGTGYNSDYYHWVINIDVNTAARSVRALAETYEIFKNREPDLAGQIMTAATKGWEFVINNQQLVDENISYRGFTVDILAAAIEMAHATNEQQFFDKADQMINESKYSGGVFRKISGEWPAETGNRFAEMDDGCFPIICKYYDFARTKEIKQKIRTLVMQFVDYWFSMDKSPQGVPRKIIDRTTNFGNIKSLEDYAFHMITYAYYFNNNEAYENAKAAFNMLTGLNSFSTSYICGFGNKTPSVNYLRRSFETGVGAVLPGFTNTSDNIFSQDFTTYQTTEGVIPVTSSLFYLLNMFNDFSKPTPPQAGELKLNEVKSNSENQGASFIEIYNNSDKAVDLTGVTLEIYDNNNNLVSSIVLSSILNPGKYYTVTNNNDEFYGIYGFEADMSSDDLIISENTKGFILKYQNEVLDKFNNVPSAGQNINYGDVYIRKGYDNDGTSLSEHWYDAGQNINGTPGKNNNVVWETVQYAEACDKYLWDVSNTVYNETGTYTYVLPNVYNIDSVITLNLTILIDKTVTAIDNLLIVNETDAEYQWLDCNKNMEPVEGATQRSFEAESSGNYAVRITKNGCTVVSDCYDVVAETKITEENILSVYPNPTNGIINLKLDRTHKRITVFVINLQGKAVFNKTFRNTSSISFNINEKPGLYLIEVITENKRSIEKIIKI